MVKKCKQCGCNLASGENNKLCENCRKKKRDKRLEVNEDRKRRKHS